MAKHLDVGEWGEKKAEKFLRKMKYKILGCRVRVGEKDELDLVARDGKELVFIEVKTRTNESYGRPSDAVDRKKRSRMSRAAVAYLKKLRFPKVSFRFDVVEVIGDIADNDPEIRHIENAFTLDRRYLLPY